MDLKTYQAQTGCTAIYKPALAPHYLIPGLMVEALELQMSADVDHPATPKEVGDVMWFTSQIYNLAGEEMVIADTDDNPTKPSIVAMYIVQFSRMALDTWVKVVRDKDGQYSPSHIKDIADSLEFVPYYCQSLSMMFGISLEQVLDYNVKKLQDRQQRGVLGGSGDDR